MSNATVKKYRYDEIAYGKKIYEDGFQSHYIPTELKYLALYARDYLSMKASARRQLIYEYCEKYIDGYSIALYYKLITSSLQYASVSTNKLVSVKSVPVYQSEVDYISSQPISLDEKRILFTLLVRHRLDNLFYSQKDSKYQPNLFYGGSKRSHTELKRQSHINERGDIRATMLDPLCQAGYIIGRHKSYIELTYIEHMDHDDTSVAIDVVDFDNIGLYYNYLVGEGRVKLCEKCGMPFVFQRKDERMCKEHKEYAPMNYRTGICMDCGAEFTAAPSDKRKIRCSECQKKFSASTVSERVKRYRERHATM